MVIISTVSYRGLTTVSRKTLIKRLDAVVKPRHDTETLCKNLSHATNPYAGMIYCYTKTNKMKN
ncbi:palindromic element RPE4 domain-containing protein [Rickettsia endosymbiont of Orchestes rusci]|uniref:palindromic element RPE4 domain-containing protein n=1 Tax=Rickettsia endosymbiont of Orchestes rusci TaxID=3066250 RepID=UPI00397823F1